MARLVADIGSTFTKARLFAPDGTLAWSGQAPTRPGAMRRTQDELAGLAAADGVRLPDGPVTACSSAAGGLRLAVLGLTRTFTYEAALFAALGAGARIVGRFAGSLTDADLAELSAAKPDVVLLTGGSDDGDRDAAPAFARRLAELDRRLAVVVACNRSVAEPCRELLSAAGHTAVIVGNVLPELGRADFAPARAAIREIFLSSVIGRLDDQRPHRFDVRMPTPAAVLSATELLGTLASSSLLVIDVGGATTDVHSMLTASAPARRGLSIAASENLLRTVEADLGVRESAPSLLAAAPPPAAMPSLVPAAELAAAAERRCRQVAFLAGPDDPIDLWLAQLASTLAIERHVGEWAAQMTRDGVALIPLGRDLRDVRLVVGTGGVLSRDSSGALARAVAAADRRRLVPAEPAVLADTGYVLPCLGVLAHADPALGRLAAQRVLSSLGAGAPVPAEAAHREGIG